MAAHVRSLAQEQDDQTLAEEIAKAHVICVVYDLTQDNSLDRVRENVPNLSSMLQYCDWSR